MLTPSIPPVPKVEPTAPQSDEEEEKEPLIPEPHLPPWQKSARRKLRTNLPAVSQLPLAQIWDATLSFLREPVNLALAVWASLAGPACLLSICLSLRLLDGVMPDVKLREDVDETCLQLVNALFFLTSLIGFPLLCRHALMLWRWSPLDKHELRQAYCKNGKRKPHDRAHIAFVLLWGQIACWTTFAFAGLHWAYPRHARPDRLISAVNAASKLASALSFLHLLLSPLSQDFDVLKEEGDEAVVRMLRRSNTFFQKHKQVMEAKWDGEMLRDCCRDRKVAVLACLFPFCMFGHNADRLGFGHRVVHALAFVVVLAGPLLVFTMSAGSLRHLGSTERTVHYLGVLLAFLGLAYGGVWRIKMRETFRLPGSKLCCGSERATDVCSWLFCSCCALCQEIRTTDQYDVDQKAFYRLATIKVVHDEEEEEEEFLSSELDEGETPAEFFKSAVAELAPKVLLPFSRQQHDSASQD